MLYILWDKCSYLFIIFEDLYMYVYMYVRKVIKIIVINTLW